MVRCSVSTIQSIELNRLQLSKSLAAEISLRTGADLDWLLANDLDTPMPPRHWIMNDADAKGFESLQDQAYTSRLLSDLFSRLFAAARKLKGSYRQGLELFIASELTELQNAKYTGEGYIETEFRANDPIPEPLYSAPPEIFEFFKANPSLVPDQLKPWIDLLTERVARRSPPAGKVSLRPRKAPSRTRRSA